jgi:hypothetical protein
MKRRKRIFGGCLCVFACNVLYSDAIWEGKEMKAREDSFEGLKCGTEIVRTYFCVTKLVDAFLFVWKFY